MLARALHVFHCYLGGFQIHQKLTGRQFKQKNMETETLDKLYLEISQFTKAKTAREIELEHFLEQASSSEHEKSIAYLHKSAKAIEKSAQVSFSKRDLPQTYEKMNLSQSLRAAANYLDGVSGS